MDLICTELVSLSDSVEIGIDMGNHEHFLVNKAVKDPTFLDDRCLENLLKGEDKHTLSCSYFNTIQKDITPKMRKMVAEWVIEVSSIIKFLYTF